MQTLTPILYSSYMSSQCYRQHQTNYHSWKKKFNASSASDLRCNWFHLHCGIRDNDEEHKMKKMDAKEEQQATKNNEENHQGPVQNTWPTTGSRVLTIKPLSHLALTRFEPNLVKAFTQRFIIRDGWECDSESGKVVVTFELYSESRLFRIKNECERLDQREYFKLSGD